MKELLKKLTRGMVKIVPMCAAMMVVASSNTAACWVIYEPEMPKTAKRHRKF